MKIVISILTAFALALPSVLKGATCVAVNVNGGKASALRQGAEAAGLDLEFESMVDLSHPPDVLVWQADEKGHQLPVASITNCLEKGGALLLTVSKRAGFEPRVLSEISPVAAWPGINPWSGVEILPGIASADPDTSFFTSGAPEIRVPFRVAMRPVDRMGPSETRPLLNREWTTRLFANSEARDSLLVTGRYGAGRVAVFASCAESGSEMFWKDVFTFLAAKPPQSPKPIAGIVSISAEGRKGEIAVTVANGEASPLKLPVLARTFSWNGEYYDDDGWSGEYVDDFAESLTFPAGKTSTARFTIPDLGRFRPQSLEKLRLCKARVGVFSPDGSQVLHEEEVDIDMSRPISVDLQAPYDEYAFSPGEKVKFTACVKNGTSKEIKLDFDIAVKPFNAEDTVLAERLDDSVPASGKVSRDLEIELPKLRGGEKFGAGRVELLFKGKTVSYVPYIVREEDKSDSEDAGANGQTYSTVMCCLSYWMAGEGCALTCLPANRMEEESVIFTYSRRLGPSLMSDATDPSCLFLSDQMLSTEFNPWTHVPNGDRFMEATREGYLETMRRSVESDSYGINYRMDEYGVGPVVDTMFSWQEIVEFDRHLRANGANGLHGRTLGELKEEIAQTRIHAFLKWQCETFLANFRQLCGQAESLGKKKAVFSGLRAPLLPPAMAAEIAAKSGITKFWAGVDMEREMAHKALNTDWRFTFYPDENPEGTAETARRETMLKAWRSIAGADGRFARLYSCDSQNAVDGEGKRQLSKAEIDARRISAIRPDGPIGMGLCLGTGRMSDENSFVFSGCERDGDTPADRILKRSALLVRAMQDRRVGVSFAANASALSNMPPTIREPLLVPLPDTFSEDERAIVATWAKSRGMIVFVTDGKAISPEFAELFGRAEPQQGSDAVSLSKYGVIIDREIEKITQEELDLAARLVHEKFNLSTVFPEGTTGYGFTSNRRRFAVVADIREKARDVTVKIRAGYGKAAVAMEFNEHRRLDVVRDGEYWSVTLPLKRGDANLIMIEEK